MFLGRQLTKELPLLLSNNATDYQTVQITNAALSKSSEDAELYLKIGNQQILICQLNRKVNLLQNSLNLLIDLKDNPALISQNGNIHVCGYYQSPSIHKSDIQSKLVEKEINTNKKSNPLESKFLKAETLPAQTLSVNQQNLSQNQQKKPINVSEQTTAPRQSSRLSSRRSVSVSQLPKPVCKQKQGQKQKAFKKEQRSSKKQIKQGALLQNGRYSLKALLQNISDNDSEEDEESDGQFSDSGQDQQSDDDSEFQEDEAEQEERPKKKLKQSSEGFRSLSRSKPQQELKERPRRQKVQQVAFSKQYESQTLANPEQKTLRTPVQIGQESQEEKKQLNTEQFQQKWPQTGEPPVQKQTSHKQQIIEELASKMKIPTKKPTI